MSLWSRIANVFRGDRLSYEIDEELESHIAEAIDQGREPAKVRAAFGSKLRQLEMSRDIRMVSWLDSLRADLVFGWRQLFKRKTTSVAAVLSLALATGACMSAFRLTDALLLRPLPVSAPERLYLLSRQGLAVGGVLSSYDGWEYRLFRELRSAVKGQAELIAASFVDRGDLTYTSDHEMEKVHLQYVSGDIFRSFGLPPARGHLFGRNDDLEPGAHPVAVLSYDYWSRRFGRSPGAIGRTFRLGNNQGQSSPGDLYEIIGVGPKKFSGTEPGTVTDIFLPTTMNGYVNLPIAAFLRTFVYLDPGVEPELVRAHLRAAYKHLEEEETKRSPGKGAVNRWTTAYHALQMEPAATGVSGTQHDYRLPLVALSGLVGLVLLIACANVANLMTAQATARAREMALRVAIGAGRWRLVQLVLVEGAILAFFATALGTFFAGWSAPFVVGRINSPDNPAQLLLPADWRVVVFSLLLTLGVTLLFGLAPALRASAVRPAAALKGGEDPDSRRRLMHILIAAQVVFCFLVLFIGGLFIATFDRLSNEPTGFSPDRLLVLDTVTTGQNVPAIVWEQVAERLRSLPGVERVALAEWALMDEWGHKYSAVSIKGAAPTPAVEAGFLSVSPGWLETMKIPLLAGRDFRPNDVYLTARKSGVAIVNRAFAKQYFNGENPIGKSFEATTGGLRGARLQIVGLVGDARYLNIRGPISPVVYNPFHWTNGADWGRAIGQAAFIVRTSSRNPLRLAAVLRREVSRTRRDLYVSNTRTQKELIQMHMVRERLLSMLAMFFAVVALLLAGVGMYGVLDYSVSQRTREIGVRMALGAQAADIARRVALDVFATLFAGALTGLALGMASVRYVEGLLYQVKGSDLSVLVVPWAAILAAALVAALPALLRAIRIDPIQALRAE